MSQIDQTQLAFYAVNSMRVPAEGPKAVPITLDFSLTTIYTLNLQNMQSRNFLSMVQSLYIDNSGNTAPIVVTFPGTQQNITLAAGRQMYVTVLCANPASMQFVSTGGVLVYVALLNFPVSNSSWPSYTGA